MIVASYVVAGGRHGPHESVDAGTAAVGHQGPGFTTSDLDGKRIALADFRGHPLLINFWATWCTACADEMPAIQAEQQQHRGAGLQVLAVNYRETDTRALKAYLQRLHVRFRVGLDTSGRIAAAYGVKRGLPVSVFVDKNGVVTELHTGAMTVPVIEQGIRTSLR